MTEPASTTDEVELRLSPSELELVRSALRMLQWTLGRDEADELGTVKALLVRLEGEPEPR